MTRTRNRPAPLRRGPLVLLGDGALLLLALSGAVGSFSTAFSLEVEPHAVYTGCLACALVFLAVWSLPRRWGALALAAAAGGWGLALWRLWDVLVLGEVQLRCGVVNAFVTWLGRGTYIEPFLDNSMLCL